MPQEIPIGTERELRQETTAAMGVAHLGPAAAVLSTPSMIGLMEACCLQAMRPFLSETENTVGTKVCITHDAALRTGEEIIIRAKLAEVKGRRYVWEVTALSADDRKLGGGTHERAVIDSSRFRAS